MDEVRHLRDRAAAPTLRRNVRNSVSRDNAGRPHSRSSTCSPRGRRCGSLAFRRGQNRYLDTMCGEGGDEPRRRNLGTADRCGSRRRIVGDHDDVHASGQSVGSCRRRSAINNHATAGTKEKNAEIDSRSRRRYIRRARRSLRGAATANSDPSWRAATRGTAMTARADEDHEADAAPLDEDREEGSCGSCSRLAPAVGCRPS